MPSFIPKRISHRDKEILQLGSIVAPLLRGFQINNVFVYGTCGTGKTICSRFVLKQLEEMGSNNGRKIKTIYVNCKMKRIADTEYRLFAQLLRELGEEVPDTGLPTDVLYRRFFEKLDNEKQSLLIMLDEIDHLFKKIGDNFLYNLTRINGELKRARLNIIGITNDLGMRDSLDMRVKSSLSEEEVLFRPYNAEELREILRERINDGFKNGVISECVLSKCAALAAQEHGDARRALDLLRVAGEIAERRGDIEVLEEHVDLAEESIDMDKIIEAVRSQPRHSQVVLLAIIKSNEAMKKKNNWVDNRLLTGDVFNTYTKICEENRIKTLTQRRVSDLITELDMLGIINARVISKGRYGRTREISLGMSGSLLEKTKKFLAERFGY
jgi:cell division control protein 6